jgi:hypothetical protein
VNGGDSVMAKIRTLDISNMTPGKTLELWRMVHEALFSSYRPEQHYMRGPGPKWHEKHNQAELRGASPAESKYRALH